VLHQAPHSAMKTPPFTAQNHNAGSSDADVSLDCTPNRRSFNRQESSFVSERS
jgi:hypothetical protein